MTGIVWTDHVVGGWMVPPALDQVGLDPSDSDLVGGFVGTGGCLLPWHQPHGDYFIFS